MNIFEKMKYKLIEKYIELFIKNKQSNNNSNLYKSSTTKRAITAGCSLKLTMKTENKKTEINEKLNKIVKKYIENPEQLINYIKMKGLKLYKLKNAEKILSQLGEEEGFLTPLKGFKALYLNFLIGIKCERKINISFASKAMFIFDKNECEIYTIARALYKYYGYKNNLPGYDYKSQEIFKRVYNERKNNPISGGKISLNDMFACKEALARDLESINFTIKLSSEYTQAKKVLKKIKETNCANV